MPPKKKYVNLSMGQHFGKVDIYRAGYFDDPPPGPFDPYQARINHARTDYVPGRQVQPGPPESLFHPKFSRLFEGESLTEPWRTAAQERLEEAKKNLAGNLQLPSPAPKHSTPGDYYGCFTKITAFDPALKPELLQKKGERSPPNCLIKPNPKGGPGYLNICLNPYPKHLDEPYERQSTRAVLQSLPKTEVFLSACHALDFFPPDPHIRRTPTESTYVRPEADGKQMLGPTGIYVRFPKSPGGNHDGCFNKFPEYISSPYVVPKQKPKELLGRAWIAGDPPTRRKYTTSPVNQITDVSCNATNYQEYSERVYRSPS